MNLSRHRENLRQILGADFVKENSYDPANKDSADGDEDNKLERVPSALSKLTGPSYGLSDIIRSGAGAALGSEGEQQQPVKKPAGPIKEAYLNKILDFLFPDAKGNPEFPFPREFAPRPRCDSVACKLKGCIRCASLEVYVVMLPWLSGWQFNRFI